jgi:hypothetical protein
VAANRSSGGQEKTNVHHWPTRAAIGYHRKIAGHEPPTNQEGV